MPRPVDEGASGQSVPTRRGHDVHRSAQRGSVLGLVPARPDLDRLDHVVRQVDAARRAVRVGDLDPVDEIAVLEAGPAVDVEAVAQVADVHARQQGRDALVVPAERDPVEVPRGERAPAGRRDGIDPRGLTHDHDLLGDLADRREGDHGQARGSPEAHGNVLEGDGPIARVRDPDGVPAQRQRCEVEFAGRAGRGPARGLQRWPLDGHLRCRDGRAIRRLDPTLQAAAGVLGERRRATQQKDAEENNQRPRASSYGNSGRRHRRNGSHHGTP